MMRHIRIVLAFGIAAALAAFPVRANRLEDTIGALGMPRGIACVPERPAPEATPRAISQPEEYPWFRRMPYQFADSEGFVHLDCPIAGMGVELDWDWINAHRAEG